MPKNSEIEWQVILNPHAGGGKGAHDQKKIEQLLKKAGLNFRLVISEYPRHAILLAHDLATAGATHLLVAGGDGTLNEVVNGIFLADKHSNHEVTLGMIPVGTGNDWTKTFGIPDNYQKAIDIIKANKTVLQNVGEITCLSEGKSSQRYFVNIAGFGFDALVAKNANDMKSKGITGIRVYIQSLLSGYFNFKSRQAQFTIDGATLQVNLFSASVGLGKFNGGGMMQVPEANPLEGDFHLTVIRNIGIWGILTNFKGLYSGEFIKDRRVSSHSGKVIGISSASPLPGEADGETLDAGSFTIGILARKLRVIYGSDKFLGNIVSNQDTK
jgi:YegS/Rv2252/BmrU family lipid kinase